MFEARFECAPPSATILEAAPTEAITSDTSNCCPDCPDAIEFPPAQSDCPNFFPVAGGRPECNRDKGGGNLDIVVEPPKYV